MSFDRRKVLRALKAFDFEILREGGNHTIVHRASDGVQIAVPRHRQLARGTVRGMAEDAGVEWERFRKGVMMSLYHVLVQREGRWYIGRVMERPGITTQGQTLDELVLMLRDAIVLMWNERNVSLELVLSGNVAPAVKRPKSRRPARTKRRAA